MLYNFEHLTTIAENPKFAANSIISLKNPHKNYNSHSKLK